MRYFKPCFFLIFSVIYFQGSAFNARPDSSSFFLFTAGYRVPVNKNVILNSGHGLYFEIGINPAKYFSKGSVLGLYAGWAWKDGLWSTSFNREFVNDYQAAIIKEPGFTGLDSAIVTTSAQLFDSKKGRSISLPGCETRSFHNYSIYYGIIIKIPLKYSPALKLYAGSTRSHFQGQGNIATSQKDYNIYQLKRSMYGCELMIYTGLKRPGYKNPGAFSLYYESCNFYNSSLQFNDGENSKEIRLMDFTTASFIQKYRRESTWGFKISYAIM